jgi:P-type Ca2+ transporter type 2C
MTARPQSRAADAFAAIEKDAPAAASWHALETADALATVRAGPGGLAGAEAAKRLRELGANRIAPETREPLWRELVEPLTEPLILLLMAVGVLSAVFGELRDGIAIFIIIGLVAAVEAGTELRARRALTGLSALSAPRARVLRDGALLEVPVEEVVPGDVLSLAVGDVVPADCRLVDAHQLALDESTLTGEPQPAAKGVVRVPEETPLAERSSMVFAGTVVVAGEGRGLVVETGTATELGRLGRMTAEERAPRTPLQRTVAELARYVLVLAVAASVLVPLIGVLRGQPFTDMLLAGLTLAFATVPEELPLLVTLLLAVGGYRLARRGALLRNLRAAETLGGVTEVVTDKTGTLTENRLRLVRVEGRREAVLKVALASQAATNAQAQVGDPLGLELAAAAHHEGVSWPGEEVSLFPFDPERKRMSRVWRDGHGLHVAAKGAPESILAVARGNAEDLAQAQELADRLANEGLRVLAFAEREADTVPASAKDAEQSLDLLGFAAFDDPLRPGVPEAIEALTGAGVRTMIVTGDHPRTAAAVAARAGLDGVEVRLGGANLAKLSDDEISRDLIDRVLVARATPVDKLRIVRALQRRGEVVAVTGDGVNDAPALAAADVGIAMGKRGTDLARETADLVVTDDAFPTIEAAIEGGRAIGSRLRRAVAFYLGAKAALVAVLALPLALGFAAPFRPVHIVILELFMDLGPSVAFVSEPSAPGAMRQPPRNPARRFLDRDELGAILLTAASLSVAVALAFFLVRHDGAEYGAAAAIATWLLGHVGVAWALRAEPFLPARENVFFPLWAVLAGAAAVLLTASPLAGLLGLSTLPAGRWPLVIACALLAATLAAAARRATGLGSRL